MSVRVVDDNDEACAFFDFPFWKEEEEAQLCFLIVRDVFFL